MRLPFAIRAAVMTGLAIGALGRPATAQPPPPPPPAVPRGVEAPPRDPGRRLPPEPVGTAVIRGRVVTSDTGNPVRRASVTLVPMPPPIPSMPAGTPASVTNTVLLNGIPMQAGLATLAVRSRHDGRAGRAASPRSGRSTGDRVRWSALRRLFGTPTARRSPTHRARPIPARRSSCPMGRRSRRR